jgi:ABC-2 type transport system permease protein
MALTCGLALRAEWTKTRTLPAAPWLLLATAALTVAVGAVADSAFGCQGGSCAALAGADPAKVALTGVQVGQALAVIVAALAISGEYGSGMIRVTLTAMPRRLTVFAAKAVVLTGLLLGTGAVAVLGSVLAGRLILPGRGFTVANGFGAGGHSLLSLADGAVLRAAAGSVFYLVLVGLLAFGTATAVRESAVAIGAALALLFLFPILSHMVSDPTWARHLEQVSPMTAGLYIQATADLRALPLTPWQGLGVLALWAFGALLLGAVVLHLRDV